MILNIFLIVGIFYGLGSLIFELKNKDRDKGQLIISSAVIITCTVAFFKLANG